VPAFSVATNTQTTSPKTQPDEHSGIDALAIHREYTHNFQMQQNMLGDAQQTISHLERTIKTLEEETRILRLDAARDDESYKAALVDRDLLKEQLVSVEIELDKTASATYQTLESHQKEIMLSESEKEYARQILIESQAEIKQNHVQHRELQEKLNATLLKLGRLERDHEDLKVEEAHQINALDSLGNKLLETQETIPDLQSTVRDTRKANQQLRENMESARWRTHVLEATAEAMVEKTRAAATQYADETQESARLRDEIHRQEVTFQSMLEDLEGRTNLEVALRSEIESLRSVLVEKNFLLEYIQSELDFVSERDSKEMHILEEALETTVRWREEVVLQNRLNEEISDTIVSMNSSLKSKDSVIKNMGKQIFAIRGQVDEMGQNQVMDVMIQDLDRLIDLYWENDAALSAVRKSIGLKKGVLSETAESKNPLEEQSMDFEKEIRRVELMQENAEIQQLVEKKYARKAKFNPWGWLK